MTENCFEICIITSRVLCAEVHAASGYKKKRVNFESERGNWRGGY